MKRVQLLSMTIVLALGCGKSETTRESPPTPIATPPGPAEPAETEPPKVAPVPLADRKTPAELNEFGKERIDNGQDWATAFEWLQRELGEPTMVFQNAYRWAVFDGEWCASIELTKEGDRLNGISAILVDEEQGLLFVNCLEASGREPPPEDPSAAAPPADGSPVSIERVVVNTRKARSRWVGKKVAVNSFYWVHGTRSTDEGTAFNIILRDKDKPYEKPSIICASEVEPDEQVWSRGDPMTVKGTVRYDLGTFLDECEFLPK